MGSIQCDKCTNDLPLTTASEVKCLFCGKVHSKNHKQFKLTESKKKTVSGTTSSVAAASIASGSSGDC